MPQVRGYIYEPLSHVHHTIKEAKNIDFLVPALQVFSGVLSLATHHSSFAKGRFSGIKQVLNGTLSCLFFAGVFKDARQYLSPVTANRLIYFSMKKSEKKISKLEGEFLWNIREHLKKTGRSFVNTSAFKNYLNERSTDYNLDKREEEEKVRTDWSKLNIILKQSSYLQKTTTAVWQGVSFLCVASCLKGWGVNVSKVAERISQMSPRLQFVRKQNLELWFAGFLCAGYALNFIQSCKDKEDKIHRANHVAQLLLNGLTFVSKVPASVVDLSLVIAKLITCKIELNKNSK
jgi:hypothetical protein